MELRSTFRQPKPFSQALANRNVSAGSLSISPDARWLAASGAHGSVSIYNTANQKVQPALMTELRDTIALSFSPNGKKLAAIGGDSRLYVWTFVNGAGTLFLNLKDVRKADNLRRVQGEPGLQAGWLTWTADDIIAVSTGSSVAIIHLEPSGWGTRIDSLLRK